jgi:hypothetical protein
LRDLDDIKEQLDLPDAPIGAAMVGAEDSVIVEVQDEEPALGDEPTVAAANDDVAAPQAESSSDRVADPVETADEAPVATEAGSTESTDPRDPDTTSDEDLERTPA